MELGKVLAERGVWSGGGCRVQQWCLDPISLAILRDYYHQADIVFANLRSGALTYRP